MPKDKTTRTTKVVKAKPTGSKQRASSSKSTAAPTLYSGFTPINLRLPTPIPIPSTSTATHTSHHIYIRPHTSKGVSDEDGRKLFVVNLPIDITERDLRLIFGRWGVIESVEFTGGAEGDTLEKAVLELQSEDEDEDEDESDDEDDDEENDDEAETEAGRAEPTFQGDKTSTLPRRLRPRRKPTLPASVPDVTPLPSLTPRSLPYAKSGNRCAHVTYLDTLPLSRALAHTSSITLDKYNEKEPSGLQYYLSRHTAVRPSLASVKAFADSSMARFDHLQSMLLSSRAKKQGAGALVDEDGFTVVVRGGRYGRTGGRGKGVAAVGVAAKGFKGDAPKGGGAGELPDFYRFQQVDRKKKGMSVYYVDHIVADFRTRRPSRKVRAGQGEGGGDEAVEAVPAVLGRCSGVPI